MKILSIITFLLMTFIGVSQTLPEDFEASIITSDFTDFDGGVATVLPNSQSSGINTSATVGQIVRNGGATWGGSKYILAGNLDFSTMTNITMKVYTTAPIGTAVKFKLEGGVGSAEADAVTTVAGAWEEITWNFSGTANTFNTIVLMFDFGNIGDGTATSTFLFDDIEQSVPPLAQIDLPVTFESATVDYTMTDFGDNMSTLLVDPTLPTNMVMQVVKPLSAPTWAGTTISTSLGFANAIPFTLAETEMSVRVWSPDAGIPVRLKVEDHTNPTISVETEALTTVAGQWETLVFDFANEAAGTAVINIANTYNKASIFFNFDTDGATAGSKTYYFDDVIFSAPPSADLVITTEVCGNTGGSVVRMTGPFWGWDPTAGPTAVDNMDGTYTFTLSPAPTADMEYLLILDGTQEDMVVAGTASGDWSCTPVTDFFSYANRQWLMTDPLVVSGLAYGQCGPCSPPPSTDLVITTEVCGNTGGSEVRMTGPFWSWDPTAGPTAVDNMDGTYTFTFSPAPGADMEYLLILDGNQEDMVASGAASGDWSCTPITDNFSYANRQWLMTDPLVLSGLTYGQCSPCAPPPSTDLVITTEVCGNTGGSEVRMTGPFWSWDPTAGPTAVDNMDGTYTFTLSPAPTADMEYLLILDGIQEDMVASGAASGDWSCTPITDNFSYANRQWLMTDPLVLSGLTYGQCSPCAPPPSTDLVITTEVCGNTGGSEVRMTGPLWGWDPAAGPIAVDNMDGTYTITLSPAPVADMEYLLILDGVQENLIQDMVDGGSCAPVTDFFGYANRKWLTSDPLVIDAIYDRCVPCSYPDISITTELCDTVGVSKVKMIRPPLWDWNNAKEGVSNGDGTWTFTYSPAPTDSLEYLIVVDQIAEDLVQEMIDGATCAPLTDYSSYANRLWELADGPSVSNTYNTCLDCNGTNSISELSLEFQIYPNPATNNITIKNAPESYEYSIFNSIGSLMLKGFNTSVVDISSLTNGIYLMVINSDDSKNQISFVKN